MVSTDSPWESRAAEMASVESDDTDFGRTFPDSGLPDCWSGRHAGLHNTVLIGRKKSYEAKLPIKPIMYPSYGLEPATPDAIPEIRISVTSLAGAPLVLTCPGFVVWQ